MASNSDEHEPTSTGCPFGKAAEGDKKGITYEEYLELDKLLDCQTPIDCAKKTHDQLLFIITHQVYELWFKQIIYEIDSVREMFKDEYLDEGKMLVLNNRLNRIVVILKTLVDQIAILETMTALDFMDFRTELTTASGFQSLQFRLLENKIGLREDNRVRYNKMSYRQVQINEDAKSRIAASINEPTLKHLLGQWLERTPGLEAEEFDFKNRYEEAVNKYLEEVFRKPIDEEADPTKKKVLLEQYNREKESFETVLDENKFNFLVRKGERSFTHRAFQGALMIALYRDEPRFSQPFQMLNMLMDIDSLLMKWRHNHVMMVQRMIGFRLGTGGSSGYQYLRSTVSDRYKPFLDLCNLATYLLPRDFIPPLGDHMKRLLSNINLHV